MTIAAVGMVYSAVTGSGFWSLPNVIGGIVLGPSRGDSRDLGVATVSGIGFHMVLSAIYGIAIVWLGLNVTHNFIYTGILVGIAIWLINSYGIGSFHAGAHRYAQFNPVWFSFVLHVLYGYVTGLVAGLLIAGRTIG
jgi:hypothetical protein